MRNNKTNGGRASDGSVCGCRHGITRRALSLGIASSFLTRHGSAVAQVSQAAGCFNLQSGCSFGERDAGTFPHLERLMDNAALSLGAVGVELGQILQVTVNPAFYDDTGGGPHGNAGAMHKPLFTALPGIQPAEGTIALGTRCYDNLGGVTAAIAGIYAHEVGHIFQYKYVGDALYQLRNKDRSVVRQELHADFTSGYYAAFRKRRQSDWEPTAVAVTQFKFGDYEFANPMHHGTPEERQAAVEAGLRYGNSISDLGSNPPENIAHAGLVYVSGLILDKR